MIHAVNSYNSSDAPLTLQTPPPDTKSQQQQLPRGKNAPLQYFGDPSPSSKCFLSQPAMFSHWSASLAGLSMACTSSG